jgi:hypothetical protein
MRTCKIAPSGISGKRLCQTSAIFFPSRLKCPLYLRCVGLADVKRRAFVSFVVVAKTAVGRLAVITALISYEATDVCEGFRHTSQLLR